MWNLILICPPRVDKKFEAIGEVACDGVFFSRALSNVPTVEGFGFAEGDGEDFEGAVAEDAVEVFGKIVPERGS